MKNRLSSLLTVLAIFALAGCSWMQRGGTRPTNVAPGTRGQLHESTIEEIEAEASRPRSGLRLAASLNKAVYRTDEPFVLDVRLVNVTGGSPKEEPHDIPVYFEPFAKMSDGERGEWLFKFIIRSEKDEEVCYHSPEFDVKEADRANYYHYVILPKDSFIGRLFAFPPAKSPIWRGRLTPGRYNMLVSYTVSEDYPYVIINRNLTPEHAQALGDKLAYIHVWTGQIFSTRIAFTIQKRRGWLW